VLLYHKLHVIKVSRSNRLVSNDGRTNGETVAFVKSNMAAELAAILVAP